MIFMKLFVSHKANCCDVSHQIIKPGRQDESQLFGSEVKAFCWLLLKPGDKYLKKMLEIISPVFARVLLICFLGCNLKLVYLKL